MVSSSIALPHWVQMGGIAEPLATQALCQLGLSVLAAAAAASVLVVLHVGTL
jgi:hypothetical protein